MDSKAVSDRTRVNHPIYNLLPTEIKPKAGSVHFHRGKVGKTGRGRLKEPSVCENHAPRQLAVAARSSIILLLARPFLVPVLRARKCADPVRTSFGLLARRAEPQENERIRQTFPAAIWRPRRQIAAGNFRFRLAVLGPRNAR